MLRCFFRDFGLYCDFSMVSWAFILLSIALRACCIFWRDGIEGNEGWKGHDDADANTIHECAYYEDEIILRRLRLLIPRLLLEHTSHYNIFYVSLSIFVSESCLCKYRDY